jgi:hypothetical protein
MVTGHILLVDGSLDRTLRDSWVLSKMIVPPPLPSLLGGCVKTMMEGGFRRNRRSGVSALERGLLRV